MIPEELVEEIPQELRWELARLICEVCDLGYNDALEIYNIPSEERLISELTAGKSVNELIRHIIARIGEAYARGELELPRQQWRADFEGYIDRKKGIIDGHIHNWTGKELTPTTKLIALTRTEEEG